MRQTRKPKLGDIIEIRTPRGLAYVQYSHHSTRLGELIRVLPGFHARRPGSFEETVNSKERFFVFYPVSAAVKQNVVSIVSAEEVPEAIREFPLMRMPGLPNLDGSIEDWWLFDGQHERPVDRLTPELERLSIAESWGHPVLVERIAEGWSPSDFGKHAQAESPREKQPSLTTNAVNYYLYSHTKHAVTEVSQFLEGEPCTVDVQRAADGRDWLIVVSCELSSNKDVQEMRSRLERFATSRGISYDGDEVAL